MEPRVCKNKKCQKPLPEGYKHKYCENCRNRQADKIKKYGKAALSVVAMAGGLVVTIATKGSLKVKK